jgi:hypothetical protein
MPRIVILLMRPCRPALSSERNSGLRPSARRLIYFSAVVICTALLSHPSFCQVSVLSQHNDNLRSGTNLKETVLTTSNVNVNSFSMLFASGVDGYIFAQPLYVPNLTTNGATRNVIFVATAADSVFAFDADFGTLLWNRNYGTPVLCSAINTPNILVQVGIISTPVIDPSTQTMYFVTKTYENQVQIFRLHAIEITTGYEKFGGPVLIAAVVNGTGDGNDGAGHVLSWLRRKTSAPHFENLTIICDPERTIFIAHRLMAARKVNDAEASVPQQRPAVIKVADVIWSPVANRGSLVAR